MSSGSVLRLFVCLVEMVDGCLVVKFLLFGC